jgi:hypothetical protein
VNAFKLASFTCGHQLPVRGYDRSYNIPCPTCFAQAGRSPTEPAPSMDPAPATTIHALGLAAYNLSYGRFRELLDEPDGAYAREKYDALKKLGRAMSAFTDATLLRLSSDYLPVARRIDGTPYLAVKGTASPED